MQVRNVMGEATVMRDVTGIFTALAPGSVSVEHGFDQLVRERRLAHIERGDLD